MEKQKFKLMELIQFYIHLASLILGGFLIVYMSNNIEDYTQTNTPFVIVMIVLIVLVVALSMYQIMRIQTYKLHYKDDPEVSIWKTITTLICYPLDIVMYVIVLIILL